MCVRALLAAIVAAGLLAWALPPAAVAAVPTTGYDVSYPRCGAALPSGGAFGIVGVNGGLANNANPCLAVELAWAAALPGSPAVSLYLNTADPGPRVPDWPTQAFGATFGTTPFGVCDASWSPACAYLYGASRAAASYSLAAGAGAAVATVPWWLDVEQVSTWAKPTDLAQWAAVNLAAIKGFVAGLRAAGAGGPVGDYSTSLQWTAITGLDAGSSRAAFAADPSRRDWVAGTGSLAAAERGCGQSFSGAAVALAQYSTGGLDGDIACPTPVPPGLRIASHRLSATGLRVTGTIDAAYLGATVRVELTAIAAGGRAVDVRRDARVRGGRWALLLALPRHGALRGGRLTVTSAAGFGVLAGAAHAAVRLRP